MLCCSIFYWRFALKDATCIEKIGNIQDLGLDLRGTIVSEKPQKFHWNTAIEKLHEKKGSLFSLNIAPLMTNFRKFIRKEIFFEEFSGNSRFFFLLKEMENFENLLKIKHSQKLLKFFFRILRRIFVINQFFFTIFKNFWELFDNLTIL